MRLPIALIAPIALVAATAGPAAREDKLAKAVGDRVAGKPESCLSPSSSRSTRIVDRRTIIYEVGSTMWVNRLRAECPGLYPTSTIVTEIRGGQLCRGDLIRTLDPGARIPGAACPLGDFTPYRRARR